MPEKPSIPAEFAISAEPALDFWDDTIDPATFLGKEHFEGFRVVEGTSFSKHVVGHAFNDSVQRNGRVFTTEQTKFGRHRTGFVSYQPRAGLIVAKRTDIGMSPYPVTRIESPPSLSTICNDYAIEAGSIVNIMDTLNPEQARVDLFLKALGSRLLEHFPIDRA